MDPYYEIANSRSNPEIDPHMHAWKWEIPAYLFLGGLVAGILVLSGIFYLMGKKEQFRYTVRIAPIFAPILLSFGMLFLFLDLSHKLFVWRLYLTFQWTSPMSWGSWALVLIYPSSILFALIQLPEKNREKLIEWLNTRKLAGGLFSRIGNLFSWLFPRVDQLSHTSKLLAWINVVMGGFIGIYTGILLSSFIARPFWNTPLLGFLFLASGISAATAFIILGTRDHEEERFMIRLDIIFLVIELLILAQIFIGLLTQSEYHNQAAHLIFGGGYTGFFWMFVVLQGILFPLFMEIMELRKNFRFPVLTPLSVLIGGLLLRILFVTIGQYSGVELHI